jgi:hypothetical protein
MDETFNPEEVFLSLIEIFHNKEIYIEINESDDF